MAAPEGYTKRPEGDFCKWCPAAWREPDGSYWCCGQMPPPNASLVERLRVWPARHEGAADPLEASQVLALMTLAADALEAATRALQPFADKATKWEANHPTFPGRYPPRDTVMIQHRLGDFRQARKVLDDITDAPPPPT